MPDVRCYLFQLYLSDIEVVLEDKQTYYICHLCNSFFSRMLTSAYLQTQKGRT